MPALALQMHRGEQYRCGRGKRADHQHPRLTVCTALISKSLSTPLPLKELS